MTVETRVFPDARALGSALAHEVVDGITAAARDGRGYVLGCPGGRSPRTTYAAMAGLVATMGVDLSGLVVAMMDDYVVADDGADGAGVDGAFRAVSAAAHYSVVRFAREAILGPLTAAAPAGRGLTEDRVWFPDPTDPAAYDQRLTDAGGVDLFILASGDSDGHVAFNPPGTPSDRRTRVVRLATSTRRDNLATFPGFRTLDEVPQLGVSVGPATIRDVAHRAVLVAHGRAKQETVARVLAAKGYEPSWPATIVVACRDPALYTDQPLAGSHPSPRTSPTRKALP
jgi:glucosamine-6-phosphate deaminase